jgi:uncharacterized alkaline shock family protein YloU
MDEKRSATHPGDVSISNDVIIELAKKTILSVPNIQLASMGLASKFGIGRKSGDGIRVSSVEDGKIKAITLDVYIKTKYGHRIPDLGLDVQEKVKANLERYTGYTVTAVNVNVQGIYLDDPKEVSEEAPEYDTVPDADPEE